VSDELVTCHVTEHMIWHVLSPRACRSADDIRVKRAMTLYLKIDLAFDWMEASCTRFIARQCLRKLRQCAAVRTSGKKYARTVMRRYLNICFRHIHINNAAPMFRRTRLKFSAFRKYVPVARVLRLVFCGGAASARCAGTPVHCRGGQSRRCGWRVSVIATSV
jgi:hypothetical protein